MVEEIWICEKQTVTKWEGDIFTYKEALTKKVKKDNAKMLKNIWVWNLGKTFCDIYL